MRIASRLRDRIFPNARFRGPANCLVFANTDAASGVRNILKMKGKKVNELEDKTELIVKHNDQLLRENERLAKLINQKKNEV